MTDNWTHIAKIRGQARRCRKSDVGLWIAEGEQYTYTTAHFDEPPTPLVRATHGKGVDMPSIDDKALAFAQGAAQEHPIQEIERLRKRVIVLESTLRTVADRLRKQQDQYLSLIEFIEKGTS